MIALEFFAGTQKTTKAFNNKLGGCKSLDFVQLNNEREIDFLIDFFEFDTALTIQIKSNFYILVFLVIHFQKHQAVCIGKKRNLKQWKV